MPQELAAFAPDLAGAPVHAGGIPIRRVEWAGRTCLLACAGIGKVAAASAAALLALRFDAELLLVIGTAARIGLGPGGPHRITQAVQADYGARGAARFARYRPGTIPFGPETPIAPYRAFDLPGLALPTACIASSDMFVESATHAAEIGASLGASLIDMETAAVAQVAELYGVPWAAIKAATDAADADSAGDFMTNLARAARAAAVEAERAIAAL